MAPSERPARTEPRLARYNPAVSRRSSVALLVAAVVLVALGATGWWWVSRGTPVAPPPLPAVAYVDLTPVGPRTARVVVEGLDVGTLERNEEGVFQGIAQARLTVLSRRFVGRAVEIRRDPAVDLELAAYVQRLLTFGGARTCVIVEAPPR